MNHIDQIPQLLLRLAGLGNLPAVPLDVAQILDTLPRLLARLVEQQPAKDGLSNKYTLAGETHTGQEFLFGEGLDDRLRDAIEEMNIATGANPARIFNGFYKDVLDKSGSPNSSHDDANLTALPLESPDQFSISWTNFENVYKNAQPLLAKWAATMTDPATAEEEFWPTIAKHGVGYNLLVLQKLTRENYLDVKRKLGAGWTAEHLSLLDDGLLYAIDMTIFETVRRNKVDGCDRFTPATITLLEQDADAKTLKPILIRVAGERGSSALNFTAKTASPSAWLYAMLAAKTSVTVHGIWLGHVYQWHIVTAAMQMTMFNELSDGHPVRELLAPQSDYLFGFDDVILLLWRQIAP
ncbi:MAG: hypothetical protein N2C14_23200, partial [Planctomycetales bacterium]